MSEDYLEATVAGLTFWLKAGCLYTVDGLWLAYDESRRAVRVGLGDYRRKIAGDVAFVELPERGMSLAAGDELAGIETVTEDLSLPSPFGGTVFAVNDALAEAPQLVNRDPYGAGWLVDLRPDTWPAQGLLEAEAYRGLIAGKQSEA